MHCHIIAATGHRPNRLGGYSDTVLSRLIDLARAALIRYEPTQVISGLALGWDTAIACAALELNLPLVAAVPFTGQEAPWPAHAKARYRMILGSCEDVVIVSPGGYSPGKLDLRNRYLADHCDRLVALWDGNFHTGTGRCISYAGSIGRHIVNLYTSWQKYRAVECPPLTVPLVA